MKRFWLGIGILVVLLVLGLWVQLGMAALYRPVTQELEAAAQAALEEQWPQALRLAEGVSSRWERYRGVTSSVADHTPMDEVDMLLAELEIYGQAREAPHFAACCSQLSRMLEAIAQAHGLNLWNLL